MEMIVPACYEPRQAKHVHVKVQPVSRPLTTQLYFSDDVERVKDAFYNPVLDIQVQEAPDGGVVRHFRLRDPAGGRQGQCHL